MSLSLRLDTANRFQRFALTTEENNMALQQMGQLPLVQAYIANKIADYASALVEMEVEYHADPKQQFQSILSQERLRHFVQAYEELLAEIQTSSQPADPDGQPT